MSQDDKILLRSLQEEDLPALAQLAYDKKIWLNVRDMLPHPYTLDDAIFFFNLIKACGLIMKANCLLKLRINYQYICRVP